MNVDPKTSPTIMCNKSQPKTTRTGPGKDLKSNLISLHESTNKSTNVTDLLEVMWITIRSKVNEGTLLRKQQETQTGSQVNYLRMRKCGLIW